MATHTFIEFSKKHRLRSKALILIFLLAPCLLFWLPFMTVLFPRQALKTSPVDLPLMSLEHYMMVLSALLLLSVLCVSILYATRNSDESLSDSDINTSYSQSNADGCCSH